VYFRAHNLWTKRTLSAFASRTSSAQIAQDVILKDGVRDAADVGVLATRAAKQVAVLVWHYPDDNVPGADASVPLAFTGLPRRSCRARVTHHRIDEQHRNSYAAWRHMGSPIAPIKAQYAQLQSPGQLEMPAPATTIESRNGRANLAFTLPRQGVSLRVLEWM
jgi:xylan 1,4-beta-xylosidase